MDMQTRGILKDFGISTKTARLPWVLEITQGANTFRIEVSKTANKSAPWHAGAYRKRKTGWQSIADFPWVDEQEKATAIRMALDFWGLKKSN
jgi:hypothetical protein